jgi:Icc-related predicted phosphoesterase
MKILFSSDLHGELEAYKAFAAALRSFDCGVLAGDLLDEFIRRTEAEEFGLVPPDEPEELQAEDFDMIGSFEEAVKDALENTESVNRRGLEMKRQKLAGILGAAGKSVFYVTGNHDIADWGDLGSMLNIEGRRVDLGGVNFVGVRDDFDGVRSRFACTRDFASLVDKRSILVSHAPPFGVLDETELRSLSDGKLAREHIGSREILRLVKSRKPMYSLFGHVHECFGAEGNMINASWSLAREFMSIDTVTGERGRINPFPRA